MSLCKDQVFIEIKEKAVKLIGLTAIGKCCTVDCIIGIIKKYYDDLAADKINERIELEEIMEELYKLEEIKAQELIDLDSDDFGM